MKRPSIDEVSPQEWDAYTRKYIESKKDHSLKNPPGMSDQDVMDNKMETDILESHTRKPDNVNSPSHYNSGAIECIDAIEAMLSPEEYVGYLRGNSLKYRWRFRYKGKPVEDLQKANWYEDKLIKFIEVHKDVLGSKSRA